MYCDAFKDGLGCVLMRSVRVVAYGFLTVKEPQTELPHT